MTERKRFFSRPLRKTFRPWREPALDSPEMIKEAQLIRPPKKDPGKGWTSGELERFWRNTSA